MQELSDAVPLSQRLYILRDRDGDYVRAVESGETETVKLHFVFTKDWEKAQRFTYDELWSRTATVSIGIEFTHGYSGATAERIQ